MQKGNCSRNRCSVVSILVSDLVPLRQRGTWQGKNSTLYSQNDGVERAIGILNITFAAGSASGGPLGGLLTDSIGWRWCIFLHPTLTEPTAKILIGRFSSKFPFHSLLSHLSLFWLISHLARRPASLSSQSSVELTSLGPLLWSFPCLACSWALTEAATYPGHLHCHMAH